MHTMSVLLPLPASAPCLELTTDSSLAWSQSVIWSVARVSS